VICHAASMPTVEELVGRMVEQEDRNFELAKKWEFEQHLVTQRLDGDGHVESEKTKTVTYRPEGKLSFSVGGLKGQGEQAEVGIGMSNQKDNPEEGRFSEAIHMRELRPIYDFTLAGEGEHDGRKVWLLDFTPKIDLKVEGDRQRRVLAGLRGRLWVDQADSAILRADCSLVKPMPFAWFDLVSLRELRIQYETLLQDGKVWLPKSMEVFYMVRVMFITHIREKQLMTADGYRLILADSEGLPLQVPAQETPP